jgi:hypothetical protein
VEHLNFPLLLIILAFCLSSCTKRDPNPELKDQVYMQIQKDLTGATSALTEKTKNLEKCISDMRNAVPQSGEIKVYEKRRNDAFENKVYAEQMVRLYEIRLAERKLFVQRKYLESLLPKSKKWPDQIDIDNQLLSLKILRDKAQSKEKKKDDPSVPRGTSEKKEPSSATEHGAAAAEASGGGEHH